MAMGKKSITFGIIVTIFMHASVAYSAGPSAAQKAVCGTRATMLAPEASPWVEASYLNGNPRCDPEKCSGTMSKVACVKAAMSFIACAHWEWDFSACLTQALGGGYSPDATHKRKILEDYEVGLAKCPGKCLKAYGKSVEGLKNSYYGKNARHILEFIKGKVARIVATNVGSEACCLAGSLISKALFGVLVPIGVAYTVGEIGAAGIQAGGSFYVDSLDKDYACKRIPAVNLLMNNNCKRADEDRKNFTTFTKGCKVDFKPAFDRCGPIGLERISPLGEACEKVEACDVEFITKAATLFSTAATSTLLCQSAIRLRMINQRVCDGRPACPPG